MNTSPKSRVEQVDELIHNLTESSDHLANLAGITENVADLAGQQEHLLNALSESTRVVGEASKHLQQTEQHLTETVSGHLAQVDRATIAKLDTLHVGVTQALEIMQGNLSDTFYGGARAMSQAVDQLKHSEEQLRASVERHLAQTETTTTNKLDEVGDTINLALEAVRNQMQSTQSALAETVHTHTHQLVELTTRQVSEIRESLDAVGLAQEKKLVAIRQENLQQYSDLESLLRLKLGESKNEIKQLIEYERTKVRELVEEQTKLSAARIDRLNQDIVSSSRRQWITLLILAILMAGLIAAFFIKSVTGPNRIKSKASRTAVISTFSPPPPSS